MVISNHPLLIVEAKSQGLIARVKPLLDASIDQAGFWVAESLYNSVLRLVDEEL
ncbi:MAG: DUF3368 domain-containing protein [Hormoscilla sp. SP5CHS1]|nr:DUF3368 domain-containing protein [Hormoscilla sp. SP12CHS1]MBC6454515.1 DUF3368 domain-containing protein [Hormoscilla sp. SP5CHS1]